MANTYVYLGPGERWAVEEATAEDKMNVARQNNDYLYEALNTIMDADAADGIVIGTFAPTGNVTMLDGMWIGLGAAAGRLGFSDAAPDVLSFSDCDVTMSGALSIDDVTDTTSAVTGSLHTDGGVGIAKALWVGTTSRLVGAVTCDSTVGGAFNGTLGATTPAAATVTTLSASDNVTVTTAKWLGMASDKGRLLFTDAATDTVAVEGAKFVVPGTYLLPLQVGTKRLWHDATDDVFRVLTGSDPISEDDGDALQEGELF